MVDNINYASDERILYVLYIEYIGLILCHPVFSPIPDIFVLEGIDRARPRAN